MSTSEPIAGPSNPTGPENTKKAERIRARALAQASIKPKIKSEPKIKPEPIPYHHSSNPANDEEAAVHEVYERIAPHFSQTRHKPWPLISTFLHSLPPGSIGLDSGGGNGKYVPTAKEAGASMVVMDRSLGLLSVARTQPGFGKSKGKERADDVGECVRGDLTGEGWRSNVFDFAISIAAVHHLSTPERRRRSVQALIQPLVHSFQPPYARFMIYVWAYEQSSGSKRRMGATATSTPVDPQEAKSISSEAKDGRVQDVLVPWVLQAPGTVKNGQSANTDTTGEVPKEESSQVLHRYYHLFVEGELQDLVVSAAKEVGYLTLEGSDGKEIEESAKWLRIKGVGWEADNWWIEGEVGIGPIK